MLASDVACFPDDGDAPLPPPPPALPVGVNRSPVIIRVRPSNPRIIALVSALPQIALVTYILRLYLQTPVSQRVDHIFTSD